MMDSKQNRQDKKFLKQKFMYFEKKKMFNCRYVFK